MTKYRNKATGEIVEAVLAESLKSIVLKDDWIVINGDRITPCNPKTFDEVFEPVKGFDNLVDRVSELGDFLLEACPYEIGAGDPVHGEGAVDVALRVLTEAYTEYKNHQYRAWGMGKSVESFTDWLKRRNA